MPGVLMRFLEIARTLPDGARDRDLVISRVSGTAWSQTVQYERTGSYVCSASTSVNSSGMNFSTVYG